MSSYNNYQKNNNYSNTQKREYVSDMIVYIDGGSKENVDKTNRVGSFGVYVAPNSKSGVDEHRESGYLIGIENTNQRMELTAFIKALEYIQGNETYKAFKNIKICTDSAYIVNNIIGFWLWRWRFYGWLKKDLTEVKNIDLMKKIFSLLYPNTPIDLSPEEVAENKEHSYLERADWRDYVKPTKGYVYVELVKGHSGVTGNEIADSMCTQAIKDGFLELENKTNTDIMGVEKNTIDNSKYEDLDI